MSAPVVTVDGPAGSGKTTLGRRLALALGLAFI
ncbi:MAG TPA: cytidylate kinase, partial [Chloroflexi bacterium]|nr:cytidylate kinase [Chloroflexota bacterium]